MIKHIGVVVVLVSLAAWIAVAAASTGAEPGGAASMAPIASAQAASNRGGTRLSFNCDVNTRKCKCDGIWEGADCQAMKKNCDLTKPTACTIEPPHECSCTLAKTIKRPKKDVRPTIPAPAVQRNPN